jgi:hypothetical protein
VDEAHVVLADEAAGDKEDLDEVGEAGGEAGVGAGVKGMPVEPGGAEGALEGVKLRLVGVGGRRLEGEQDDGLAAAGEGAQEGQTLGSETWVEGAGGGEKEESV